MMNSKSSAEGKRTRKTKLVSDQAKHHSALCTPNVCVRVGGVTQPGVARGRLGPGAGGGPAEGVTFTFRPAPHHLTTVTLLSSPLPHIILPG